jgi:hypothetical protein
MICLTGIANYFSRADWTGFADDCPSGKSGWNAPEIAARS